MEDRKEYKSVLFKAVSHLVDVDVRQVKAEVSLQLILKQLDQILAEIGQINKTLKEAAK